MKLHLPHLLRRCLLSGLSVAIPCTGWATATAQAEQILPTDGIYHKYYLDNGKYYLCYLYGGTLTGGGTIDFTVVEPAVGAYGAMNTDINNSAGSDLSMRIHSNNSYGISGGILSNAGTVDITTEGGGSTGIRNTVITNDASGTLALTSRGTGLTYGIDQYSTLNNSGSVTITAESTNGIAEGVWGASISNAAGGILMIQSRGTNSANGLLYGSLHNSGTVEITAEDTGHALSSSSAIQNTTITNKAGGTITVRNSSNTSSDRKDSSYGIYLNEKTLTNSGVMDITAENSGYGMYGIYANASTITNNEGGSMTIRSKGSSNTYTYGLCYGTLSNGGALTITTEATDSCAYGINLATLTNEEGSSLTVHSKGHSGLTYGIVDSALTNRGMLNITVESTNAMAWGLSLGTNALYNEAGSSLVVQCEAQKQAYAINTNHVYNKGRIEAHARSAEAEAYGLYLHSYRKLVNSQGASVTASGTTAGVSVYSYANFYNEGALQTDSVLLDGGTFYMLDGSSTGGYTENAALVFSGSGTLHLGGALGANDTVTGLASGSSISTTSGLNLSGVTVSLTDDVRLSMAGDLSVSSVKHNGHKLTVNHGDATHRVSMGSSVAADWNGAVTVANEGGKLTLSSEGGNTVSGGTLSAQHISVAAAEGSSMKMKDMALTVSGSEMELANIEISGKSSFTSTSGLLTLNVDDVTIVLDGSNSSGTLQEFHTFSLPEEEAPTAYSISSDMLEGVNVTGSMTLDLSYWAEDIMTSGSDTLTFSFADDMLFNEASEVKATLNGTSFAVANYSADNMLQFTVADLTAPAVPEPATATLSLLALTALAARRRRK